MRTFTNCGRWLAVFLTVVCLTGTAYAQRTVTLTLNTATIPDTTNTTDFIEVRGAVNPDGAGFVAPFTFTNGGATIDWSDASTIEPQNIGGDYWQVTFQVDDAAETQFKFYSQQTQDAPDLDGWEVDPNPVLGPGATDSTFAVHFFEFNGEYRGLSGDKGDYDWRPYESKEDSVAVWFRIFACTADAQGKGYNPNDQSQSLAVRGDPLGGASMLTWGDDTGVSLQREGSVNGAAGFDLYSGVGYYPTSAAGTVQPYKFFINGTPDGWESSDDRTFTVPASDSTLHWNYFGQSAPTVCGATPTAGSVVFSVDTTPLEEIGLFDKARGDTLQVRGGFNGWDCDNPDDCLLIAEPGTNIFEADIPLILIPGTTQAYKFFIDFNDENFIAEFGVDPPSGWEEPLTTQGSDRTFEYGATGGQFLGDRRFNDVFEGNIIPDGVSIDVLFTVDMTPATDPSLPVPFDAAVDTPYVFLGGDAIWAFTQGLPAPDGTEGFDEANLLLSDDDGDMIYTGTLTLTGPTYSAVQYQYGFAGNNEPGTGTSSLGRRRTRFVAANADGTWPATWDFVAESFQPESGALPFESNPVTVGVEAINDEVPEAIWLGANYPNPFNPTTTFEYAVDRGQNVTIRVYDMLGRVVATLVNGMQPPATYQVSFDASHLASGVYFYRLETQTKVISKRMLLVK